MYHGAISTPSRCPLPYSQPPIKFEKDQKTMGERLKKHTHPCYTSGAYHNKSTQEQLREKKNISKKNCRPLECQWMTANYNADNTIYIVFAHERVSQSPLHAIYVDISARTRFIVVQIGHPHFVLLSVSLNKCSFTPRLSRANVFVGRHQPYPFWLNMECHSTEAIIISSQ